MWTEETNVVAKSLKLSVDGNQKTCDLVLDLGEFPSELAYGLPSGLDQLRLLNQGHLSAVTFTPDGEQYQFRAQYLADHEMTVMHARVMEVKLQSKQDKDGVITIDGKMAVRFWWTAEDLLFFAENLSHEMVVTLVKEQLELPLSEDKPKRAKAAA